MTLPEDVAWGFDAGYFEGCNIKFLIDKKIDGYIPDNIMRRKKAILMTKNILYTTR